MRVRPSSSVHFHRSIPFITFRVMDPAKPLMATSDSTSSPMKSVATCDMQPEHRLSTLTRAESLSKITSRSLLASAFRAWLQRTGSASASLWSAAKRGRSVRWVGGSQSFLSCFCALFCVLVRFVIDTQPISSTARITVTMEVIATQSSVISTSCPRLRCTLMDCCGHFSASHESDDPSMVEFASASTVESQ